MLGQGVVSLQVQEQRVSPGLPVYLTRFIGRVTELEELRRRVVSCFAAASPDVPGSRLVTLVGAAGCGKTRLAVEVADRLSTRGAEGEAVFPDQALWATSPR